MNPWSERQAKAMYEQDEASALLNVSTLGGRLVNGDVELLESSLSADLGDTPLKLMMPLPDGRDVAFVLTLSPVVAGELGQQYPMIRTFSGHQIGYPDNKGRFDITPQGFHGMFQHEGRTVFIDPRLRNNQRQYISYYKEQAQAPEAGFVDQVKRLEQTSAGLFKAAKSSDGKGVAAKSGATILRTYRLALATAGEYSQFHGGTKALTLAAMVTLVNRINQVYEQELAVRLELVANNDDIIFTDPDTDPFNNDDDDSDLNQDVVDDRIGSNNYDIGHVLVTGAGGLAGLGVVCLEGQKAIGVTGHFRPTGDTFYIDYVAHELGHQFGADHSFNGTADSCGAGNRVAQSAYEPGSGSTIMSYASICGGQNLQLHSDAYFHARSLEQIESHLSGPIGSQCGVTQTLGNQHPQISPGSDYVIPAQTPFMLSGSATDVDGDTLTYGWEQYDLGSSSHSPATMVDNGNRPLFRSWPPTTDNVRYLPRLTDVLNNTTVLGETYATTNRTLNFRLTVRDGNGGITEDDVRVTTVASGEAFKVISPGAGDRWQSGETAEVRWQLGGSDQAPIDCTDVEVALSMDQGQSFVPVATTANDGEMSLQVPTVSGDQARLRLRCVDNVFYAVNDGAFSISAGSNVTPPSITGQQAITFAEDGSRTIEVSDMTINDPDNLLQGTLTLTLVDGANYSVTGSLLTPDDNFSGTLNVPLTISNELGVSAQFTLEVTVQAVNDAPVAVADSLSVAENSSAARMDVLANDTDVDSGDVLSLDSVDYQGSGLVAIESGQISYTPAAGFSGTETIQYQISDTANATASGTLTITVQASGGGGSGSGGSSSGSSSSGGAFSPLTLLGTGLIYLIGLFRRGRKPAFTLATCSGLLLLTACQQEAPINEAAERQSTRVQQQLVEAMAAGDYRLWISGGRRPVMPGIDPGEFDAIKQRCGTKLLADTGDVRGDDAQYQRRQQAIEFAKDYNQQILRLCRQERPH